MKDLEPQNQTQPFEKELPQELVTTEIFPRLPIKSLIRFKSVSKQWKSIISSTQFARFHLQFQQSLPNDNPQQQYLLINTNGSSFLTFDYSGYDSGHIIPSWGSEFDDDKPSIKEGLVELELGLDFFEHVDVCNHGNLINVAGSCNGLICLSVGQDQYVYIWNPTTRELCKISNPPSFRRKETIWGFGYVSSIDDYKIVSVSQKFSQRLHSHEKKACTLSLRDGRWEYLGALDGYNVDSLSSCGVLVGEIVFWRMLDKLGCLCVVGFDLVQERFEEVELPEWISDGKVFVLCVLGGCLCAWWRDLEDCVQIAMLKKQCGDSGSWVKFYCLACENYYCCSLFGFTGSGKILMYTLDGYILLIDVDQDHPTHMEILRLTSSNYVVSYVPSLVSPFGLIENSSW